MSKQGKELHPFPTFPYRLEYMDGKDKRVCHFPTKDQRKQHIKRYKLRKNKYTMDDAK